MPIGTYPSDSRGNTDTAAIFLLLGLAIAGAIVGTLAMEYLGQQASTFQEIKGFAIMFGLHLTQQDRSWVVPGVGGTMGLLAGAFLGGNFLRAQAAQQILQRYNGEFSPGPDPQLSEKLLPFFINQVYLPVSNILRLKESGIGFTICNVDYTTPGADGNDQQFTRTVAFFEPANTELPEFSMQPEGFMSKIASKMSGAKDINFAAHPKFSSSYFLSAVQEDPVRKLFSDDLIKVLEGHPGLYVTSRNGRLLVRRGSGVLAGKKLALFTAEVAEIFSAFQPSS